MKRLFNPSLYNPHSLVPKTVSAWRTNLDSKGRKKIATAIASPEENPELFTEGWTDALEREKVVEAQRAGIQANGHSGTCPISPAAHCKYS